MDIDNIFKYLESNQTQKCEEAKKNLLELIGQIKDQGWPVQCTMEYYLKTGSVRIMDVLVRVPTQHGTTILDRLADWLKIQPNRVHALNLFAYVVRRHPTWLIKLKEHRLIKDIIKLLTSEKDIVTIMSALLCIVTLLPIIPNLVPNFLVDLCEVFVHLATFNCQNTTRLPEDKLVHLQLGLQLLFNRLYGMYPCNFLSFLSDFAKKRGSTFRHTIEPLLQTVRVHPMLVTATTESEVNAARWKEMEPHDVVMECVQLSLPIMHQHCNAEHAHNLPWHCNNDWWDTSSGGHNTPAISSDRVFGQHYVGGPIPRFDLGSGSGSGGLGSSTLTTIWSPYKEITSSGPIPLTPTPSYMLPPTPASAVSSATAVATTTHLNNPLLGVTGSSPPEAAVEATPETTPMKESKELKTPTNPLAVRAIFGSSQPSSPMRREQQNQFSFPDVSSTTAETAAVNLFSRVTAVSTTTSTTTTYERRLQQIIQDRTNSQSPFQTIEAQAAKHGFSSHNFGKTDSYTPEIFSDSSFSASMMCEDCGESDRNVCRGRGMHLCIGSCMHVLAKNIRRPRITTYSCNETSYERLGIDKWVSALASGGVSRDDADADGAGLVKVRRTKSCSSFPISRPSAEGDLTDCGRKVMPQHSERRLQKSGRMMAIDTATKKCLPTMVNVSSQTVEIVPNTYESSLLSILEETQELRNKYEASVQRPSEKLDQYILQSIRTAMESDQEKYQLLWLQLQYESYRREIHAERNRRLMGRSRNKRNIEMERDRLLDQLESFATRNKELMQQIDKTFKTANEHEKMYTAELTALKAKYQNELEQNRCLRQANENLQSSLSEEQTKHQETQHELNIQLGKIFNMSAEMEQAQSEANLGLHWKQELARLEAEFIVMGEVQIKCRDRLAELDNFRARDEELRLLQESFNIEMKELRHTLEDKSAQLDSARYKIAELQAQLQNNDKVITEQKRLLKAVKDEYEEKFRSLNRKYEVQKTIIMQMEEKIIMSLQKPHTTAPLNACSPDTDRTGTDMASSVEHNSPLSLSLASSESFSASLRSTEMRNLQHLVETPILEASSSGISVLGVTGGGTIIEGTRLPALDLASSANTATGSALNILASTSSCSTSSNVVTQNYDMSASTSIATTSQHMHPHLHLQQQQHQQQRYKALEHDDSPPHQQ